MEVCLYIAEHNQTGMKYFGKTTSFLTEEELQKKYFGSGRHWNNHLKKHGKDVTMKIYGIYKLDEVEEIALKFSEDNNIVKSYEWANEKPENGLDGGSKKGLKRKKIRTCNHCNKELYPSEEMYHFEYCKENPKRLTRETECNFCGKIFKDNTGCKNHELICDSNPKKVSFECQYCDKEYKDLRNRNKHEKTCELNPEKEEYFCKFCNKEYKTNSALIKHQNICIKNPNAKKLIYKCKFCDKEFKNSKINLIKHEKHYCKLNSNIEKLEFKCECGKTYSDKGNFSIHKKKCKG